MFVVLRGGDPLGYVSCLLGSSVLGADPERLRFSFVLASILVFFGRIWDVLVVFVWSTCGVSDLYLWCACGVFEAYLKRI